MVNALHLHLRLPAEFTAYFGSPRKKEGKDVLKLTLNLPLTEEEVDQVHCVGPILPNNTPNSGEGGDVWSETQCFRST